MKREKKVLPFEIKSIGADDSPFGVFSGYGSVFGELDSYGDIVTKGAYTETLREDNWPAMLWQHDSGLLPGAWLDMREDDRGLFCEGEIADTTVGREAYALMKQYARIAATGKRLRMGLSIGFSVKKNGSSFDEDTRVRTLTSIKLWEVSLVTFPANDPARISAVKADGALPSEREFERFLHAEGFSGKEAQTIIAKGFRHLVRGGSADADTADCVDLLESIRRRATFNDR